MDGDNFILFPEYTNRDGKIEIHFATAIYKTELIEKIQDEVIKKGFKLLGE